MTREEYIGSLADALSFLNEDTRSSALAFYIEMLDDRIEDGMDEQSAVAAMEKPEAIAARLRTENGAGEAPFRQEQKEFDFSAIVEDAMRSAQSALKAASSAVENTWKTTEKAAASVQSEIKNAWNSAQTSQPPEKTGDYERRFVSCPASQIHAVRLQATDMPIKVTACADDKITLTYYTCKHDEYRACVQDGVLILEPASSPSGLNGFRFSFFGREMFRVVWDHSSPTIELAVPADALIDLTAKTSNGSVRVQDLRALCETDLATTNSRIALENITCKQLFAHTNNGRLVLKNIASKCGLLGKTSNSRIEGERLSSGGDMNLITSNGSLTVTDAKAGGIMTLKSSNSRLNAQEVASAGAMTLTTSNGSLTVERISAPALTLRTSNAAIHGTLPGPQSAWNIESGTSNGRNSLPKQQPGEKPLLVHTSNGSIDLTFSE